MDTSREDETADSTTATAPAAGSQENGAHRNEARPGGKAAPAEAAEASGKTEAGEAEARTGDDFVEAVGARSPARGGGVFSPEALSLTGLLLLLPVLVGGRLMERVAWFGVGSGVANPEQLALLQAEMLVTGAVSALAVLLASVSLFTGGARTRAWARWSASAVVVAGVFSLLMSLTAFLGIASTA